MAALSTTQAILPIAEISTYQTKWTIKARVTNKVPLRSFTRKTGSGGEGKVFSVDLLDAEGSDIRASFFNGAADVYVAKLEVGKCYTFSGGSVRIANKQYNQTSHRYELSFDMHTQVTECEEDTAIKAVKFNFVDLRAVQAKELPCRVDLCGVITSFKAPMTVRSKERELLKRDIVICDDTATSIDIALWGELAQLDEAKLSGNPVIGLKNVLIKEWNGGRGGSALDSNALSFNLEGPETQRLQRWWAQGGSNASITALSVQGGSGASARSRDAPYCSLSELRSLAETLSEEPKIYNAVCRLALVQTRKQGEPQPLHYMACAEAKEGNKLPCNRRVDAGGYCGSCGRAGKTNIRLNARCRYADFGDSLWLTTFHEGAEKVFSMTGEELQKEHSDKGQEHLEAYLKQQYFAQPLQLTVRAKLDAYNGELRPNTSCIDARPVNRREHGRALLKQVQEMLAAGVAL